MTSTEPLKLVRSQSAQRVPAPLILDVIDLTGEPVIVPSCTMLEPNVIAVYNHFRPEIRAAECGYNRTDNAFMSHYYDGLIIPAMSKSLLCRFINHVAAYGQLDALRALDAYLALKRHKQHDRIQKSLIKRNHLALPLDHYRTALQSASTADSAYAADEPVLHSDQYLLSSTIEKLRKLPECPILQATITSLPTTGAMKDE